MNGMIDHLLAFDVPPFRLSGVVYAAVLNDARQLAALGSVVDEAPYKAAPVHPVLTPRPRNTLARDGDAVVVPAGIEGVEVAASLGIVIGCTACRVPEAGALACVAGYLIVHDVQLPLASHYRPAVRWKARDGFCPLGSRVVPASAVPRPDALSVRTSVDGKLLHESTTGGRVRGVACLLADVTDFMTLQPGDVLMLGAAHGAPLVRAGQSVASEIEGLGRLVNHVVAQGAGT